MMYRCTKVCIQFHTGKHDITAEHICEYVLYLLFFFPAFLYVISITVSCFRLYIKIHYRPLL
jgi:hypothetical protein